LSHIKTDARSEKQSIISVDIPQTLLPALPQEEERTVEVLQVDEAALEAELEEIKRNAEAMQKISVQNKPSIIFDVDDEQPIPTLAQHIPQNSCFGHHRRKKRSMKLLPAIMHP